jgi:hypothetical protein
VLTTWSMITAFRTTRLRDGGNSKRKQKKRKESSKMKLLCKKFRVFSKASFSFLEKVQNDGESSEQNGQTHFVFDLRLVSGVDFLWLWLKKLTSPGEWSFPSFGPPRSGTAGEPLETSKTHGTGVASLLVCWFSL